MKILFILLGALFIAGCKEAKNTYIKTDRGLVPYSYGYCELGMLLNNDMINILDEDSNPMTCNGYVNLTREEHKNYTIN